MFVIQDLRLNTAAPLALITQDDILAEIRAMKARYDSLECVETSLVDEMMQKYSLRLASIFAPISHIFSHTYHRPLDTRLTEVYKNSKMNDSPPFSFTSGVCELEQQTTMKTMELQKLANSLETDVRDFFLKDSQLKRFDAFIEKWC